MESTDFNSLVALDALLQESSVSGAARRLGLSTPAMSHALARIRERFDDPILVRAGRSMVLTPRAEALRSKVRNAVVAAEQALAPETPFSPSSLQREFTVHMTDAVLQILGAPLDSTARREAPGLALRFVPNTAADADRLRAGDTDLAVGIYGDLPPEMRIRQLLTDRFVCVVRADHPTVKKRLTLKQFTALDHVQVAPRGRPGGYVDDLLADRGLKRRVTRAVPYFGAALELVAGTDCVLTVSERVAVSRAERLGLRILEPPLSLDPYALSLVWHPRLDADPAHAFLRDLFVRAAGQVAGDRHPGARRRLTARRRS